MYKAFHDYVPRMATPEMTAELEEDMDQIAAGKTSKDEVLRISREMLHGTTTELEDKKEDLAKQIWAGMDEDKFLGPCKVCEEAGRKHEDGSPNRLRIIELKGGKRMYGCEGWNRDDPESPDSCPVSGPLPGRGYELWRLEERCSICGEMPRLTVKGFRGRPWKLCLNDDCPSMVEMRAEARRAQGARRRPREAKAAAEAAGASRRRRADAARAERQRPPAPQKPSPQTARTQARPAASPRSRPSGVFVTLEGIDRSGKTTQAALLREALGPDTLLLREPGGTEAGERIRDLLKDAELELDAARRAAAVLRRPGRALLRASSGRRSTPAATWSATASSTRPSPTREPPAGSASSWSSGSTRSRSPGAPRTSPSCFGSTRPGRRRAASSGSPRRRGRVGPLRGRGHRVPANRRRRL